MMENIGHVVFNSPITRDVPNAFDLGTRDNNDLADALSKDNVDCFHSNYPQAKKNQQTYLSHWQT